MLLVYNVVKRKQGFHATMYRKPFDNSPLAIERLTRHWYSRVQISKQSLGLSFAQLVASTIIRIEMLSIDALLHLSNYRVHMPLLLRKKVVAAV